MRYAGGTNLDGLVVTIGEEMKGVATVIEAQAPITRRSKR
jgi:hypothetical protein